MKTFLLATVVSLVCSASVSAAPVTWTLNNVSHSNGTITGTFIYDADLDEYSDWSIYVTGAPLNDGPIESLSGTALHLSAWMAPPLFEGVTALEVYLEFDKALTNLGGTIDIVPGVFDPFWGPESGSYLNQCGGSGCGGSAILGGSISAVPVPAAAWLFGTALAGLAFLRRHIDAS